MDVTQDVLGGGRDGYSIPAPSELLLASSQQGHPTELARLSGARLVVASELEDGQRFAEARIKQLTGGDRIAARFMGKDFFEFTPTHTIWLHANHQPKVTTGGPALWRRMRLIPFVHVVPEKDRVTGLEKQLFHEEGPMILAWIIQGCVDYLAYGLAEPESVRAATMAYEKDQDTVARFVEECCVLGNRTTQGMSVRVPELRSEYEQWCKQEGETPVSAKALTMALKNRYEVGAERSRTSRYYTGIHMTHPTSEVSHEPPDEPSFDTDWGNR
jgi:putative DNA primase/helicase